MGTKDRYAVDLEAIDETQLALVGGKAAHLGALARTDGIRVPAGFCVTTDAFRRILAEAPSIGDQLDALARLDAGDRAGIRALSDALRRTVATAAVPDDVAAAIALAVAAHGERAATRSGRARRPRTCRPPPPPASRTRTFERRGSGRGPRARPAMLGLAVHRFSSLVLKEEN